MFVTYNLKDFGITIKELRMILKLTQQNVSDKTQIHVDTLRKIENGNAIPRYETLELLSRLYRIDLLEVLKSKRIDKNLSNLYMKLDELLLHDKIEELNKVQLEYEQYLETYLKSDRMHLVDISEITYFSIFIKASLLYHRGDTNSLIESDKIIFNSLQNTNSNLSLINLNSFQYSAIELRLLSLSSAINMDLGHYSTAIAILLFLLDYIEKMPVLNLNFKKTLLKIICNLSYCSHFIKDYSSSLSYSKLGIKLAMEWHIFYMLPNIYARKAISEIHLKLPEAQDSFNKCIHLLEISFQNELAEKYIETFESKYNMTFTS